MTHVIVILQGNWIEAGFKSIKVDKDTRERGFKGLSRQVMPGIKRNPRLCRVKHLFEPVEKVGA